MIQLDWYIPDKVLAVKLSGNITDRDLLTGDTPLVRAMNQSQSDALDMMLDFGELASLPSITTLVKLRWAKHPRLSKVIVVGSWEPFTLTASIVAQLFHKDILFADNYDEAHRYLNPTSVQHYTDAYA